MAFRAGASLSLRVLADLGQGQFRVLVQGRELVASSTTALVVGSIIRARVEVPAQGAESSSSLLLRLIPGAAERRDSILASLGLPADPAGRAALAASLAEGLRPESGRLSRMRRAVSGGREGDEGERAGWAASLEAKGLGADSSALDALQLLARGGDGGERRGGEGGRGGEDASPEPRRPDSATADESSEAGPAGTDDPSPDGEVPLAALATLIRGMFARTGPDSGLLGLFNHARLGAGEVLVPFRFELGDVEFRGSFRLHLPHLRGGPLRLEARFASSSARGQASSSWGFVLDSTGRDGSALRLSIPPGRAGLDLGGLERSLGRSGCSFRGRVDGDLDGAVEVDEDA